MQITQDRTAQPSCYPKLIVATRCPNLDGGDSKGAQALRELVHLRGIGDLLEQHGGWRLGHDGDRREPGGEVAGRVTSGGYGYTLQRSIAYASVPPEHAESGTATEIEIFGQWIPGEVGSEPLFDPKMERIKA